MPQTIIGDELGGSVYTAPKPKAPGSSMASVFGGSASRRSGRERDVPTGLSSVDRGSGRFTFQRKAAPPPPPVPTETVIGDPLGGTVVPKPKGKPSLANIFGPGGRPSGSQSYSDPDHPQAERDFRDWSGL